MGFEQILQTRSSFVRYTVRHRSGRHVCSAPDSAYRFFNASALMRRPAPQQTVLLCLHIARSNSTRYRRASRG
jgi:hypothetical protein